MTCMASILHGLMNAIDGWAVGVLTATAADIEAKVGKSSRKSS